MKKEGQKVVLALEGTASFKKSAIDDFVISLRSFQGGIERCMYDGCVSPAYTVLAPSDAVSPAFYAYLLKSSGYITELQSRTQGIREGKSIKYGEFSKSILPVPPRNEQIAIAAFLDHETGKIDDLISEQEQLIALLDEKRQAVISHAVTKGLDPDVEMKDSGIEWLGEVPAHWISTPLKRKIVLNTGGTWGDDPKGFDDTIVLRSTEQTVDGKWRITDPATRNVSENDVKNTILEEGDLLITKSSGSSLHIGKTTLVNSEVASLKCCYSNFMQRIRASEEVDPKFLWYFMNNQVAREQFDFASNSAIGLANLNSTIIGELRLALPPHDEQIAIIALLDEIIEKIEDLASEAHSGITLLKERRSALISAAVTGKIDVRKHPAAVAALNENKDS